jgi:hypothetical protein
VQQSRGGPTAKKKNEEPRKRVIYYLEKEHLAKKSIILFWKFTESGRTPRKFVELGERANFSALVSRNSSRFLA